MFKKISLVDQKYETLREEIISLQYKFGSKLSVSDLEKKYQISSTPVREALNRLQREGLIQFENNIGAKVIDITEKDVYEIQELAMTLHKAAVRLSMEKSDHNKMASDMMIYIEEYEKASDPMERVECVHNTIGVFYSHCNNQRLINSMDILKGQQLILRNLFNNYVGMEYSCLNEYKKMHDEVIKGNINEIISILEQDKNYATPIILKALNKLS